MLRRLIKLVLISRVEQQSIKPKLVKFATKMLGLDKCMDYNATTNFAKIA